MVEGPPVKWVVFLMALFAFQFLIAGNAIAADEFSPSFEFQIGQLCVEPPFADEICIPDFIGFLVDVLTELLKIPILLAKLAAFTFVDGMPDVIRLVIGVPAVLVLAWSGIVLAMRMVELGVALIDALIPG